jgi:hypothetical protein
MAEESIESIIDEARCSVMIRCSSPLKIVMKYPFYKRFRDSIDKYQRFVNNQVIYNKFEKKYIQVQLPDQIMGMRPVIENNMSVDFVVMPDDKP